MVSQCEVTGSEPPSLYSDECPDVLTYHLEFRHHWQEIPVKQVCVAKNSVTHVEGRQVYVAVNRLVAIDFGC